MAMQMVMVVSTVPASSAVAISSVAVSIAARNMLALPHHMEVEAERGKQAEKSSRNGGIKLQDLHQVDSENL